MSTLSPTIRIVPMHMSRRTQLRLVLTGVLLTTYFFVLAVQAYAQTSYSHDIVQGDTAYFSPNTTTLSRDAMHKLDALANGIKSHNGIVSARVVGFADRIENPPHNESLSRARAENVKNYLASKGIVNARVADTRWFGDSLPATNCPENLSKAALIGCLQQDRRVEVEVDYTTQVAAAQ